MTPSKTKKPAQLAGQSERAARTVILADEAGTLLSRGRNLGFWDRVLAHGHGSGLDARLATGAAPDKERLLAVRAGMLVRPASRERLARDWELLLRRASGPLAVGPQAPLRRESIAAAAAPIHELELALRSPLPVPARGVAMARVLLTDATGPVYSRRSSVDLRAALRQAIHELDPWTELLPASESR